MSKKGRGAASIILSLNTLGDYANKLTSDNYVDGLLEDITNDFYPTKKEKADGKSQQDPKDEHQSDQREDQGDGVSGIQQSRCDEENTTPDPSGS